MMKTIDELWYGNVSPFEQCTRGTGSVHQVGKNVWEGRYTPTVNGKRIARNIYADSEEACEVKLEELI